MILWPPRLVPSTVGKTGVTSGHLVRMKTVWGVGGPHSAAQAKKNNKKNIAGRNFFNIQHCGGHLTGHVMTVEAQQRDERRDAVEHVQNPNQDYLTFGSQQRFSASLSVRFHSRNTHRLIQSVCLSVRPTILPQLKFSISNLIPAEQLTGRSVRSSCAVKR